MANNNQLGGISVVGGDQPRKNTSVATIAAGLVVLYDASNPEALFAPPGVVLPTQGATGITKIAGITLDPIEAGKVGRVRNLGAAVTTANGTIATGNYVMVSTAASKVGWVMALAGTGEIAVGQALNDAADGDPVLVRFQDGKVGA